MSLLHQGVDNKSEHVVAPEGEQRQETWLHLAKHNLQQLMRNLKESNAETEALNAKRAVPMNQRLENEAASTDSGVDQLRGVMHHPLVAEMTPISLSVHSTTLIDSMTTRIIEMTLLRTDQGVQEDPAADTSPICTIVNTITMMMAECNIPIALPCTCTTSIHMTLWSMRRDVGSQ